MGRLLVKETCSAAAAPPLIVTGEAAGVVDAAGSAA